MRVRSTLPWIGRALAATVLLFTFHTVTAQHVPVIQLASPAMPADSVVHTTEDRITVGGRVLSSSDVVLFKVNKTDVVPKENGLFLQVVLLEPGSNVVRIGAGNKEGKMGLLSFTVVRDTVKTVNVATPASTSQPPVKEVHEEPSIAKESAVVPPLVVPPVVAVPYDEGDEEEAAAAPLEIRALIIAVGKHQFGPEKDLKYPAKDALAFYDFITSPEGLAADPKNVRLLVDENATREAILGAMRDMMNGANSTDLFFLYFSGHGQTVDNGQEYYFFTHDTKATDQGSIVSSALSRSEVRARLQNGKVRKKVLFLDACYSGMMASGGKSMGERREHLFEEMAGTDEALVVFTSSSDTEQSFEDDDLDGGHGIFTYYLVKGLQGEADKARGGNKDGKVTVYELDRYLGEEVNTRAVHTKNQPQRPKRDCTRCDDFPLSVTTDYDITTAIPRPAKEVEWVTPPAPVESSSTPGNSPSGRNYESYKLPPVAKEIYVPAENPRVLNGQVYANATTGDKITFDGHHYANVVVTGTLGGQVLSGPGTIGGIQIAFTDEATTDRMTEGFAVFSADSSSLAVTLQLKSGGREKYALQRMGVAKREPLTGRRFVSGDGQTELGVYNVHYNDIAVSGHVGNTIIDAKGQWRGDVLMFVDERKAAYASGQLVLSDDWTSAQGVAAFGNGTRTPLRLESSYEGPEYEVNNGIYANQEKNQTINFHSQHYATIMVAGIVGEENIQCTGTVKGDVISLNDEPENPGYRPSKLVLRDKGRTLQGEVIFKDGNAVRVNMVRAK
ncbi:MAG: caspase family protein [Flavobacteriales bacterium]